MHHAILERVFREASGRIVSALTGRFRDLDLSEEAFSEACVRAATTWSRTEVPKDPDSWLYRVAQRCAIDRLRQRRTEEKFRPLLVTDEVADDDSNEEVIPDERLRLIFVCCHPAIAVESRAALTLKLVCGLSTREIADAFLVPEATMAQRFVRAKRKIAESGIGFDVPGPNAWADRLDAVLSTLEIAYAKAHEDAACDSAHANYATEMLQLTRTLAALIPQDEEVLAIAATVHFSEARRRARVRSDGTMCPLSEQDPNTWSRELIAAAQGFLGRALDRGGTLPRTLRARIQAAWCSRSGLHDPAPWHEVLSIYDELLARRDDPFVRINRAVVLSEVLGPQPALDEIDALDREQLDGYGPFHAVRADFLRKLDRSLEAIEEYTAALACIHTSAEREWLRRQVQALTRRCVSHS